MNKLKVLTYKRAIVCCVVVEHESEFAWKLIGQFASLKSSESVTLTQSTSMMGLGAKLSHAANHGKKQQKTTTQSVSTHPT